MIPPQSSGWMPAFASLNEQKRGSEANVARRQSMSDQQPKGGIFSQFFHKYVILLHFVEQVTNDPWSNSNFGRDAPK